MNKSKETAKYWFTVISDIFVTAYAAMVFGYVWFNRINDYMWIPFLNKGNWMMIIVYTILFVVMMVTFHGYQIGLGRVSQVALSQVLASIFCNCISILLTILVVGLVEFIGDIIVDHIIVVLFQCIGLVILTFVLTKLRCKIFPPDRMLLVNGEYHNSLINKLNSRPDRYVVAGQVSCDEKIDVIQSELKNYDAVLLNDVPTSVRNEILKACFEEEKEVYFTPKISDILVKGTEELNVFDTPLYVSRNVGMSLPQRFIKRFGDILISLIGIIITSPIMLVTAILIKKYDGGPVFYKQTRSTIGGKEFKVMKFRSMITDAEKDGKARLATENDDRITPVGKFIRATRIDELPQFFNILKGDMSLVGPRPERPEINKEYYEELPEFAYRLRVKAGLTGYAQVYGKYNTTSYDKLKLDLIYVERCSILLDIQLILLTLRVVFTKDATEGLEEGQTNASTKN